MTVAPIALSFCTMLPGAVQQAQEKWSQPQVAPDEPHFMLGKRFDMGGDRVGGGVGSGLRFYCIFSIGLLARFILSVRSSVWKEPVFRPTVSCNQSIRPLRPRCNFIQIF